MSFLVRAGRLGLSAYRGRQCLAVQPKRSMGGANWTYRHEKPSHPAWVWNYAAFIGFMTVSWMIYMTYNHSSHITGEFPDINPETFTDEELGIPPDDEDIYPPGYVPLKQR